MRPTFAKNVMWHKKKKKPTALQKTVWIETVFMRGKKTDRFANGAQYRQITVCFIISHSIHWRKCILYARNR